ncbi:MAG: hypothetical protein H6Q89_1732 [Myxococcaceae bacterium]|nr:hypothetical protein [Myxococcaceae bacterium]
MPPPDSGASDAGGKDGGRADGGTDAGKPDAGAADAGFLYAPIEQWCQLNALAQCDRDVRCLELAIENRPECIAKKSEFCDQPAYTRAANEGRLQYLEPKARECLNGYAADSCEGVPPACAVVFAGKVAPDAGCILTEECNAAGFCYQYDYTCPHRCRGWIPMGQTCDGFSTRCNPDEAYCGTFDGGVGERCQTLKGLGEDCVEYDACRTDLTCANNLCVKRRAGPGESCGERQGFPYCTEEYFCRQNTTLTPPPPGTCQRRGGLGAVCTGYGSCLPSLRCGSSFTTSTCLPRLAEGEKCSSYGECQQGLYCPPRTSRCTRIPGDGGDCTSQGSYFECASAHFCDFNSPNDVYTCRPRHANDESCTYDGVCLSNDCDYGALPDGGYGGTCVPRCSQKADSGF